MRQFFYKTRNIFGLTLLVSPMLGMLPPDRPFLFYLVLLAGAASSTPILGAGLRCLPFRGWLFFCCLAAAAGQAAGSGMMPGGIFLSALLLGFASSGLLLLLPPVISVGWFRRSKTMVLSLVWSSGLLLMVPWQAAFRLAPSSALAAALLSMAVGSFLFLQRPPVDYRRRDNPLTLGRSGSFVKPSIFTASIAAGLGMAFSLSLLVLPDGAGLSAGTAAALPILAAAPLVTGLFIERKGIFSGCVFLIFLCEGAVLCMGSFGQGLPPVLGLCLLTAAAGSFPVVLPVLTLYLYGHVNYAESFGRLVFFLPVGLLCALPFCYLAVSGELDPEEPVIFLLFLLVLSFFCIFSAWKHRFVILKNTIL